jgi:gamma-glutamylcyclotransferase (GGCT)/AIG2-like uncharacterized protein YtfP
MPMLRVFVYGTLKPGFGNYRRYCEDKVVAATPAIAPGQIFALPVGYPAMIAGAGWVTGCLLDFADPSVLTILDQLEGYDPERPAHLNEYDRQRTPVYDLKQHDLGTAWCYRMRPERVHQMQGTHLPEGEWPGSLKGNFQQFSH